MNLKYWLRKDLGQKNHRNKGFSLILLNIEFHHAGLRPHAPNFCFWASLHLLVFSVPLQDYWLTSVGKDGKWLWGANPYRGKDDLTSSSSCLWRSSKTMPHNSLTDRTETKVSFHLKVPFTWQILSQFFKREDM